MDNIMQLTLKKLAKAYELLVDNDRRTYEGFISFCDNFTDEKETTSPERNDNDSKILMRRTETARRYAIEDRSRQTLCGLSQTYG